MPRHDFGPGFGDGIERGFDSGFHWFGIVPLLLFAVLIGVIVWTVIRLTREGGARALVGAGATGGAMAAPTPWPARRCDRGTAAPLRSRRDDAGGLHAAVRGPPRRPGRSRTGDRSARDPAGRRVSDAGTRGGAAGPATDGPARVLVVDDESNITDLVSTALRYEGFDVATARDGREALSTVEAFRPDLIVLDVMLPDADGFEVQRKLLERGRLTPVVFLTARDATEDKVRGLTIGGDDYVTKPFSLEELVARIRSVLGGPRRGVRGVGCASPISIWTRTPTRCGVASCRSSSRSPSSACCATCS